MGCGCFFPVASTSAGSVLTFWLRIRSVVPAGSRSAGGERTLPSDPPRMLWALPLGLGWKIQQLLGWGGGKGKKSSSSLNGEMDLMED